ncbi:hypothetical protein C8R43DRAFT_1131895 [Mycena crocata]|nr:hypothetical protein C8R43DRAFT_1131895 [Mycena crocata]
MTDVYAEWSLATVEEGMGTKYTEPSNRAIDDVHTVLVVNLFEAYYNDVCLAKSNVFVACTFLQQGMVPVAPTTPSVVITIRALEVFRITSLSAAHV